MTSRGLRGTTRLAGLVGWPVAHSRSPRLHNEWLRRYGIDGAYVPLPVPPGRLEVALRGLQASGFAGVNVTIPHKLEAFRLSDVLSDAARRCGSVNTLRFAPDGSIVGDSSDGQGFVDSVRAAGVDPSRGPALVLGAGGAARAIAAALQAARVQVHLANRTRARAEELAELLAEGGDGPSPRVLDWGDREAALGDQALLVNTTSIGMTGASEARSPCRLDQAPTGLVVCDIVYAPRVTPLLAEAGARGLRTVEGLGMLLHQARAGFADWFGVDPAVDAALFDLVGNDEGGTG
ncbi:shikimate dehydrogenase [Lichenicola sp.]|uniref:shikimate dehydrogenase n=1 Tax=Lichenicola sp. TaxID=2804529 RepID=UPI003B00AF7B